MSGRRLKPAVINSLHDHGDDSHDGGKSDHPGDDLDKPGNDSDQDGEALLIVQGGHLSRLRANFEHRADKDIRIDNQPHPI
jgi:hypothetical protein